MRRGAPHLPMRVAGGGLLALALCLALYNPGRPLNDSTATLGIDGSLEAMLRPTPTDRSPATGVSRSRSNALSASRHRQLPPDEPSHSQHLSDLPARAAAVDDRDTFPPSERRLQAQLAGRDDDGPPLDATDVNEALPVPASIMLLEISPRSATLEWAAAEAAAGYNVYLCEERDTHWSNCTSVDVNLNRTTLEGLKPDGRYRLDIVAIGHDGRQSKASEVLHVETLSAGTGTIDIPAFAPDDVIAVNNACYLDCANTYALRIPDGQFFDLTQCSRRCEL